MDKTYEDLLSQKRQRLVAVHPLISSEWSYEDTHVGPKARVQNDNSIAKVAEQVKALDSVNVFAKEQGLEKVELSNNKVNAEGPLLSSQSAGISFAKLALEKVLEFYQNLDHKAFYQIKYDSFKAPLQVLFIADEECFSQSDESLSPLLFSAYFDEQISQLFWKMTKAMKLSEEDFFLTSVSLSGHEQIDRLFSEIIHYRPKLIMTLGAKAYHAVAGMKTRLKDVHGQFVETKLINQEDEYCFRVMPIFSPKLLYTSPNMKKAAWTDMQKAMEYLK